MIARLLVLGLWLALGSAHATTYLVTLCPDGTPCRLAEIDSATEAKNGWASGKAPVPVDGSCPLCQVVDQATYNGYQAALLKPVTTISADAFRLRFTAAQAAAVWAAAAKDTTGQIGAGLIGTITAPSIDPADQKIKNWLSLLVSSGALTQTQADSILAP